MSRPRWAALHLLRGAPVRLPGRAGRHVIALGEAWPAAGALGSARPGGRRKRPFILPIRARRAQRWLYP